MQISNSERPGVYSSYSTSKISGSRVGVKSVGIVATNAVAEPNKVYTVVSTEEAEALFGAGVLVDLVEVALSNGALSASCVPVAEATVTVTSPGGMVDSEVEVVSFEMEEEDQQGFDGLEEEDQEGFDGLEEEQDGYVTTEVVVEKDYEGAFALLEAEEGLAMILCDSMDLEVQQLLRGSVEAASEERKERIGIVALAGDLTVAESCAQAKELNSPRMVLVGGKYTGEDGGIMYAAAVAGVLATETDPALPLNGLELSSVEALEGNYSDKEVDMLLGAGVLALEQSAGVVTVIRGVTTSTMSGGVVDYTWRDLTTIMVVDHVIPELRALLKSKFQRSKNTALTRGTIRSEVVMELDRKLTNEIIVDYSDVSVEASEYDGSICVVSFSFAVAYGLNQIWISANVQL